MPGLETDEHHAHLSALVLDLHRQISHIPGRGDAGNAEQAAIGVVAHAGGFGIRTERIALHHP